MISLKQFYKKVIDWETRLDKLCNWLSFDQNEKSVVKSKNFKMLYVKYYEKNFEFLKWEIEHQIHLHMQSNSKNFDYLYELQSREKQYWYFKEKGFNI